MTAYVKVLVLRDGHTTGGRLHRSVRLVKGELRVFQRYLAEYLRDEGAVEFIEERPDTQPDPCNGAQ